MSACWPKRWGWCGSPAANPQLLAQFSRKIKAINAFLKDVFSCRPNRLIRWGLPNCCLIGQRLQIDCNSCNVACAAQA
eukprot:1156647-Pelagomonas_calceolata.AAC.16